MQATLKQRFLAAGVYSTWIPAFIYYLTVPSVGIPEQLRLVLLLLFQPMYVTIYGLFLNGEFERAHLRKAVGMHDAYAILSWIFFISANRMGYIGLLFILCLYLVLPLWFFASLKMMVITLLGYEARPV